MGSPGLLSPLPFLERGLSTVDVLPRVTLGEQDRLFDVSAVILDEVIDGGDVVDTADNEGATDDDDDVPDLEEPVDNNDIPGLEGLIGDANIPGRESPIDGDDDDDVPGLEGPVGVVVTVAVVCREEELIDAPLELEIERAGTLVLRFGGGSNENPGMAEGCQARGLIVGEFPLEVGVLLDGRELTLLAEDDLPETLAEGWLLA